MRIQRNFAFVGKVRALATILIAEDDRAVREFVSRALRQDGHDITAVGDGQQALNALEKGQFDMLLVGLELRDSQGPHLRASLGVVTTTIPMVTITWSIDLVNSERSEEGPLAQPESLSGQSA